MRLHSDLVTYRDIQAAATGIAPGVQADVSQHRSRTHKSAFEVTMTGNGYPSNSGNSGAGRENAATWDEWGVLIGRLYVLDPAAVWGTPKTPIYQSAEHFHWVTCGRFAPATVYGSASHWREVTLPADTHKRHKWNLEGFCVGGTYRVSNCVKCTAIIRRMTYGRTFAEISEMSV